MAEILDLGNGIIYVDNVLTGSLAGGSEISQRYASVNTFVGGLLVRVTTYVDIDEARAAAEHLALERADA
jgi:hypothetical protein